MAIYSIDEQFFPQLPTDDIELGFIRVSHEVWSPGYCVFRKPQLNQKLILVVAGTGTFQLDGVEHLLEPGKVCLTSPDHTTRMAADADRLEVFLLALTGHDCAALVRRVVGINDRTVSLANPLAVQTVFEMLIDEARQAGPHSDAAVEHLLHVLLHRIAGNRAVESSAPPAAYDTFCCVVSSSGGVILRGLNQIVLGV